MRTIEDAAKEYIISISVEDLMGKLKNPRGVGIELLEAFKAGAAFAQRWIPVKNELPEDYKEVIGKVDYQNDGAFKNIHCLVYRYNGDWWFLNNNNIASSMGFTHWRQIDSK
jgi:hypothetical protein